MLFQNHHPALGYDYAYEPVSMPQAGAAARYTTPTESSKYHSPGGADMNCMFQAGSYDAPGSFYPRDILPTLVQNSTDQSIEMEDLTTVFTEPADPMLNAETFHIEDFLSTEAYDEDIGTDNHMPLQNMNSVFFPLDLTDTVMSSSLAIPEPLGNHASSNSASGFTDLSPSLLRDVTPPPLRRTVKSGEKRVTCLLPGCTTSFTRSADRDRHMRKHNAVWEFPCPQETCKEEFYRGDKLAGHIRKKHNVVARNGQG